jgi:hypothetical protein
MLKFCPTCKQTKELTEFNKNKSCKDGYQRECRECCHNHHNRHYHTKKSPRLKENLKEGYKICSNCKQELLLSEFKPSKNGRFGVGSQCKSCFNIKWNEYQSKTKQQVKYFKKRKQTDPLFKLKYCIRLRVNEILKKNNITKNHSGLKYLGCDVKTYKEYIEKQFTPEMNWDNHGIYWEVDHIKPLVLIKTEEDCFIYFNYQNTQPLTISDNRKKGSTYNNF